MKIVSACIDPYPYSEKHECSKCGSVLLVEKPDVFIKTIGEYYCGYVTDRQSFVFCCCVCCKENTIENPHPYTAEFREQHNKWETYMHSRGFREAKES